MARTFISQPNQVFKSETYTDILVPGSTLSSSAGTLEDDLNALRTLVKLHLLGSTGSVGNWYDDLSLPTSGSAFGAITGSKRGLVGLNQDLYNAENKNLLYRVEVLPVLFVSASQNWVVLAAPTEAPTQNIALNDTVLGAVAARLTGTFNSNNLDTVMGANNVSPKNLVLIVSASDGQPIPSPSHAGRDIFGLLQVSGSAVEGQAFNNTTNAAQISFVTVNSASNALEAVPASEIADHWIQYAYVARTTYTGVPEDSFLTTNFADFSSLVDITLATAVANQSGPFTQTNDIDWAIANGQHLAFLSGGLALLRFDVSSGGTKTGTVNLDNLNIATTNTVNFKAGASFATGSSFINVGVTANQIDGAAGLTIKAVNNLLLSGNQVTFADAYNAGSSYVGNLPLATSSGDWSSFATEFGSVSILAAFDKLYNSIQSVSSSLGSATGKRKATGVAVLTASAPINTNLSTNPAHQNLSGSLPSLVGLLFDSQVVVYLNGVRQYAGSTNDVVPGTGLADGDLRFPQDKLGVGTIVQVDTYY